MPRSRIIDLEGEYAGPFSVFVDQEGSDVLVYQQCPKCGRFVKAGKMFENGLGEIKLKGWICKKCGEVEPFHVRV